MKYYDFTFVVGTVKQREKLLKFIDKHKLCDDTISTVDRVWQPTWRYPKNYSGKPMYEVEFRTHWQGDLGH